MASWRIVCTPQASVHPGCPRQQSRRRQISLTEQFLVSSNIHRRSQIKVVKLVAHTTVTLRLPSDATVRMYGVTSLSTTYCFCFYDRSCSTGQRSLRNEMRALGMHPSVRHGGDDQGAYGDGSLWARESS